MVLSSNIAQWARVDITLKALEDPTSTKVLQFVNRPSTRGDSTYLPLLKSYSGLSLAVGQDGLPRTGTGSIVISDQWEALGENRRVFDLFDRYTAINQTVTVYRARDTIANVDLPADWTLLYTGKIETYEKSKEEIVFSVSNNKSTQRKAGRVIDEDMADSGYVVPEQSLGKYLPIAFLGTDKNNVPAYPLNKSSETSGYVGKYAFAVGLKNQFGYVGYSNPNYGNLPLIKNEFNQYCPVYNGVTYLELQASASAVTDHGSAEFLRFFDIAYEVPSLSKIVTGFRWYCKGLGTPKTPTGKIKFTLYRHARGTDPINIINWNEIQSVEVDKSDYLTELGGSADFLVTASLPKPIICGGTGYKPSDYDYGIGVVVGNYAGVGNDFTSANSDRTDMYYTRITTGGGWLPVVGKVPRVGFATAFSSFKLGGWNETGLNYNYVEIDPKYNGGLYSNSAINCDCTELEVAVQLYGMEDQTGIITGTANSIIERPDHVIKLLDYVWDGTNWVPSNTYDFSTFSSLYSSVFDISNPYFRKIAGFSEGDVSVIDLIYKIVSESSCFLVPLTNGKLALWPWGASNLVVKTFTDNEIIEIGEIRESDPSTVINSIVIEYGRNYTEIFEQYEANKKAENIAGVVVINKDTNPFYHSILNNSEALYGKRELENTSFQFIGDLQSATSRALYYALRHNHTHRTFTMTVPLFDNTDLKLMDIVDVQSVHLPAHGGTSSDARLPVYNGQDVDLVKGEYWRMAQRRRCQIIGISNDYDAGQFPTLEIELREIKPRHSNDPTAANL